MKKSIQCVVVVILAVVFSYSSVQAGYTNISFTDFNRNRTVECVVYYPSYFNQDLDTSLNAEINFATHLVGFIPSRTMHWRYYPELYYGNSASYMTVTPTSYMDSTVPDSVVAMDLIMALLYLHEQNIHSANKFYRNVPESTCIVSHGSGAPIAVLAARYAAMGLLNIDGCLFLAPRIAAQSTLSFARQVPQRSLLMCGTGDCVAPVAVNATKLYDSLGATCKSLVLIPGESHCGWTTQCPPCQQLEQSCPPTLSKAAHDYFFNLYYAAFTDNLDQWCRAASISSVAMTVVQASTRIHDVVFVRATKDRACVGDTVSFRSDSTYANYLWLPDSVRTPVYTVRLNSSIAVTLIVQENCFQYKGGFHVPVGIAEKIKMPSDASICDNNPVTISIANESVYSDVTWWNGSHSPSVSIRDSGVYYVRAYDARVCAYAYDTVRVTHFVPPSPALKTTIASSECDSQEVVRVLFNISSPARHLWSTGQTSKVIDFDKDGAYTVWLLREDSLSHCVSFSDTIEVVVNSAPRRAKYPVPTITRFGSSLYASTAYRYQWKVDDIDIPGATQQSYSFLTPGLYSIAVTYDSIFQCQRRSRAIDLRTTDVHEANLAQGCHLEGRILMLDPTFIGRRLRVYNTAGLCVVDQDKITDTSIDLHRLSVGLYFLECDHERSRFVLRDEY